MDSSHIKNLLIKPIKIALFTVLVVQSQSVWSGGFRVTPLKLNFDTNSKSASLKIQNDSDQKVNLQLEAMTWNQGEEGKDLYTVTREIIFFPKNLSVDAKSERIVRVNLS